MGIRRSRFLLPLLLFCLFAAAAVFLRLPSAPVARKSASPSEKAKKPLPDFIKEFSNKRVILFGESHKDNIDNEYFLELLPLYAANGFGYLGIEIRSASQVDINLFQEGKISLQQLGERVPELDLGDDKLSTIVEKASALGFKVVALDNESEGFKNRNRKMSERIFSIIDPDPQAKIIIFVGGNHANLAESYVDIEGNVVTPLARLLKERYGKASLAIDISDEVPRVSDYRFSPRAGGGRVTK